MPDINNPLIIQSDKTMLLEINNDLSEDCQIAISRFAELEKSPEYLHTYRITPLSLWNAGASKLSTKEILEDLEKYTKYPIPKNVINEIKEQISRYGKIKLTKDQEGNLFILSDEKSFLEEISRNHNIQPFIESHENNQIKIHAKYRGHIKQALIKIGFPVEDLAGYEEGAIFSFNFLPTTRSGKKFQMRNYQRRSIEIFHAKGAKEGGSGVVVLPCGAGKTIVGMGVIQIVGSETLILVTNTLSIRQWKNEILDKTDIDPKDIGEYSGDKKEVLPITIATYNIITHKKKKGGDFTHFDIFSAKNWGLVVYDEVHLLPAPVFRMTSELQAKRRLGLTATLVREDGLEEDVFSLIGPKKYDVPWKDLEKQAWIANAYCIELRIPMTEDDRMQYSFSDDREKYRLSSENILKIKAIESILKKHGGKNVLIIGQYIAQLEKISSHFKFPLITGKTPLAQREEYYNDFRNGNIPSLVVSRVANFSIDLPDASLAIQVSGTFGSRQEEAQRLGRVLRPKKGKNIAFFYSLVSQETTEERFGQNRQLFLTEQGYEYQIYTLQQYKNLKANIQEGIFSEEEDS